MNAKPEDGSRKRDHLLQAIGLVAIRAAAAEDVAWTLRFALAGDSDRGRIHKDWKKHTGVARVLTELDNVARQRLDADLAERVVRWAINAQKLLWRRNDVIHSVWPIDALDFQPFRLRPGSQPLNEESFTPVAVDLSAVQELAGQLAQLDIEGTNLEWAVLDVYPEFLWGPWTTEQAD